MESGFKWPCFSYAHWPGLAHFVPIVTQCLLGDRGCVPRWGGRSLPEWLGKAPGGVPGSWGEGQNQWNLKMYVCVCRVGGDLKDYLTKKKKPSESDLYEI